MAYTKEYYQKNKPLILERQRKNQKKYRETHRAELSAKDKIYKKETLKGRYYKYKSEATRRGVEFLLNLDEFEAFWKKPCSYCGEEIITIGIDRVDNKQGYKVGNTISCCRDCNFLKGKFKYNRFIELCRKIAKHHEKIIHIRSKSL